MLTEGLLTLRKVAHASSTAIVLLVVANLVPLVGVLFFGWDLVTLLFLYWVENAVIGAYAIGRAMTAAAQEPPGEDETTAYAGAHAGRQIGTLPGLAPNGRVPVCWVQEVVHFCLGYGLFWVVHGLFLVLLLPLLDRAGATSGGVDLAALVIGGFALAISHGASFRDNWLRRGEYRTSSPGAALSAPYDRIAVLQATIVFGALAVATLGSAIWMLALLVALKTVVDLATHLGERKRAVARAVAMDRPADAGQSR